MTASWTLVASLHRWTARGLEQIRHVAKGGSELRKKKKNTSGLLVELHVGETRRADRMAIACTQRKSRASWVCLGSRGGGRSIQGRPCGREHRARDEHLRRRHHMMRRSRIFEIPSRPAWARPGLLLTSRFDSDASEGAGCTGLCPNPTSRRRVSTPHFRRPPFQTSGKVVPRPL